MKLRKYQSKMAKQVVAAAGKHGPGCGIMMQLPTGGGKTAIGADLLRFFADNLPNLPHAWLTHRRELRDQSGNRLEDAGLQIVKMSDDPPDRRHWHHGCVNIISPSLRKWPPLPPQPGLLIVDEAHHTPASTWAHLIALWESFGGVVVGLTATPWRLSRQQGFTDWYDELICGPTVAELQKKGWLATPHVQAPQNANIDFSDARVASTGDYDYVWMEQEVSMLLAHRPVIDEWKSRTYDMDDRRTLWFVPTVHCAQMLVSQLGKSARILTSETPSEKRDCILRELSEERIVHLVSVDVLSEGIDVPSVPIVASLRPTQSVAVWLQQCGRGSRPKNSDDGGVYHVFDYAGNAQRHGVPDEDRFWSLEPRAKHQGGNLPRPGSKCYHAGCGDVFLHPSHRECWCCGRSQYFECEECHVHRRWTSFGSLKKLECQICGKARKEAAWEEARKSTDERLSERFSNYRRGKSGNRVTSSKIGVFT